MVKAVFIPTDPQLTLVVLPPFFITFATILCILRFWARKQKRQNWGADDFLCLAALIITWVEYVTLVLATVWGGYGIEQKLIPKENIEIVFKILAAFSEHWGTAIALVQASILCLYLRIFNVITWFRYMCYVLLVLVFIWWASFFVTILTACIPLRKYWVPSTPGVCINQTKFLTANVSSHIALDVLIFGMVVPVISNLKTSLSKKLTVLFALLLGIFSTACAVTRFILVANEWDNPNQTSSRWMGSLFEILENASGIICCSLPIMTFLIGDFGGSRFGSGFRRLMSYSFGSSNNSRNGDSSGNGGSSEREGSQDDFLRHPPSGGSSQTHSGTA